MKKQAMEKRILRYIEKKPKPQNLEQISAELKVPKEKLYMPLRRLVKKKLLKNPQRNLYCAIDYKEELPKKLSVEEIRKIARDLEIKGITKCLRGDKTTVTETFFNKCIRNIISLIENTPNKVLRKDSNRTDMIILDGIKKTRGDLSLKEYWFIYTAFLSLGKPCIRDCVDIIINKYLEGESDLEDGTEEEDITPYY